MKLLMKISFLFILLNCRPKEGETQIKKDIIIFNNLNDSVSFHNNSIDANPRYYYKKSYGNPNVYVMLYHSPSNDIHTIRKEELLQNNLIDSDTVDFDFWFHLDDSNVAPYLLLQEDYLDLIGAIEIKKVKIYEIYVQANSIE